MSNYPNNNANRSPVRPSNVAPAITQSPQVRVDDEYSQSYIAMLNVMRRMYELWGDPQIKEVLDKAERGLARRAGDQVRGDLRGGSANPVSATR